MGSFDFNIQVEDFEVDIQELDLALQKLHSEEITA